MQIIVAILVILFSSTLLGEFFARFGLEKIAGQLISGIILGPALLHIINPADVTQIENIAIYFIILYIGIEVTTDLFKEGIDKAITFSISSFILPMLLISIISISIFQIPAKSSLIMSIAIAVPSISIISVMVIRNNLLNTEVGQIILFSTVISDLLAFTLLSLLYVGFKGVASIISIISLFIIFIFALDRFLVKKKLSLANVEFISEIGKEEVALSVILLFSLIVATVFLYVGVSFILGVFFAGVLIRKEILGENIFKKIDDTLSILNNTFFIPIFFSIAGMVTSIPSGPYLIIFMVIISIELTLPFYIDYLISKRIFKDHARKMASIFSGRGAVGLLVATLALSYGLLNANEYSVVIISTVILSLFGSLMIRRNYNIT